MARSNKTVTSPTRTSSSSTRSLDIDRHGPDYASDTSLDEFDPLHPNHDDFSDSDESLDDGYNASQDENGTPNGRAEKARKNTRRKNIERPKRRKQEGSNRNMRSSNAGHRRAAIPPWLVTSRTCIILLLSVACIAAVVIYFKDIKKHYIYATSTVDGQSPPWYPSPKGGTFKRWEESYRKASDVVGRMSLLEKVNVTTGIGWSMGMCVGNTGPAVDAGFPSLCLQDGPLGLRFVDNVTSSPAGITVGATWNKDLMYKRGRMLGLEARAKGVNVILGPSVGPLGRIPAGGRNFEGFGSDPVLQGIAASHTVRGIQDEGVMATIKHLVGNEQEHFRQAGEWGNTDAMSSNMDDRTLHEVYAWPFADSIRAGVASLMCSYNQVNNSYACQNSKLLNGIVKDEMGFQGFIQSDWLAQRSGVSSALAGLDMSMPGDGHDWADGKSYWGPHLTQAALNRSLPLERLDDMTLRIVAAWYQLGQDDLERWPSHPPKGEGGPNFSSWTKNETGLIHQGSDDSTKAIVNQFVDATQNGAFSHGELARRIAAEGIILLKNDQNLLPLTRYGGSRSSERPKGPGYRENIAVIGEDAVLAKEGPNVCEDHGCNRGTLASGWGSGTASYPYLISPLQALRDSFHQENVSLSVFPDNGPISQATKKNLGEQDLCFVFVNSDGGEGFIAFEGIKGDRNDLKLQKGGERLIKEVSDHCGTAIGSSVGKVVVVIHAVGPVLLESFIESSAVGAVLLANLPGQESGNALADVLFGRLNPSGHLPYTIAREEKDYGPAGEVIKKSEGGAVVQQNFTEGLLIDHRWFDAHDIVPRFEFGFGMSYTTFELSGFAILPVLDKPTVLPSYRPAPECEPPETDSELPSTDSAVFPPGWRRLKKYVYPYINSVSDVNTNNSYHPPNESAEDPSQAGGGEGGHPDLWEVLANVEVAVANLGESSGQAVVQVYVAFPQDSYEPGLDEDIIEERHETAGEGEARDERMVRRANAVPFPVRVLRAFDKIHLQGSATQTGEDARATRGEVKRISFELTRRDLSFWSVTKQNWVLPRGSFEIQVGFSSRDIRVKGALF
ncbi:MAG: hypothetical protein M1828_004555 [Chrysothrix sp. TS-e1954]|nr:MAG: hypothetical protein M1828_004555 [Chrysothrix sp. TS-e1954]